MCIIRRNNVWQSFGLDRPNKDSISLTIASTFSVRTPTTNMQDAGKINLWNSSPWPPSESLWDVDSPFGFGNLDDTGAA